MRVYAENDHNNELVMSFDEELEANTLYDDESSARKDVFCMLVKDTVYALYNSGQVTKQDLDIYLYSLGFDEHYPKLKSSDIAKKMELHPRYVQSRRYCTNIKVITKIREDGKNPLRSNYWHNETVTEKWADFNDKKHGNVKELTNNIIELLEIIDIKNPYIIELGCGQGRNLSKLIDIGYNVLGVEINNTNITQSLIDYPDKNIPILLSDSVQFLSALSGVVDIIITCSHAYLVENKIFELIQNKCKYYICIEPSENTYFTPGDKRYNRYDYQKLLPKMSKVKQIDSKWDNYTGYLFRSMQYCHL